MKLRSAIVGYLFLLLHIAVGLIKAGRKDGAGTSSSKTTCPPGTYFSLFIPGCVACPENCHSEAFDNIDSCLSACSIEPEPSKPVNVVVKTKRTGWQLAVFIALPLAFVVLAAALVAGGYHLRNRRRRRYSRADIESDPNDASASNVEGNLSEEEPTEELTLGLTNEAGPSTCESGKPVTHDSLPSGSKDDLVLG